MRPDSLDDHQSKQPNHGHICPRRSLPSRSPTTMTLARWFAAWGLLGARAASGQLFVQDPMPERMIDACPDYTRYSAAPQ